MPSVMVFKWKNIMINKIDLFDLDREKKDNYNTLQSIDFTLYI